MLRIGETTILPLSSQVEALRGQLAAAHAELQSNAGALAEAEQAQSQIDWLHGRLLSATEEVQVGARLDCKQLTSVGKFVGDIAFGNLYIL